MFLLRVLHSTLLAIALHPAFLSAQISIVDDLQRTIRMPGPARRIVSLAPSITECLFAIGAGDQVAGVTDFCNYPADALGKPRVGGMINPDIESVVGLDPDLIVLSMEGNVRKDFERLTSFGTQVFVTNPRTLEGICRSIAQLGTLTGRSDSAAKIMASMRTHEQSLRFRVSGLKPVRTILAVSIQPLMCAGRNTFIDQMLQEAGAVNLAASARGTYPVYSRERVIADDPDVIIVMSDALRDSLALLRFFPEWKNVSAVLHHRVYLVEADIISRPGPRAVDALDYLVRILHPTP